MMEYWSIFRLGWKGAKGVHRQCPKEGGVPLDIYKWVTRRLCPTEIWAVAWIQGKGKGLKRGQACPTERIKITWNPAEMEET